VADQHFANDLSAWAARFNLHHELQAAICRSTLQMCDNMMLLVMGIVAGCHNSGSVGLLACADLHTRAALHAGAELL
jgi:hypothetical protein